MKIKLTRIQPGEIPPAPKCNQGSCEGVPAFILHEPKINKVTTLVSTRLTGWCSFCGQKFLHLEEVAT